MSYSDEPDTDETIDDILIEDDMPEYAEDDDIPTEDDDVPMENE